MDGAYIRIRKGTTTGTLASQAQIYEGFVASADTSVGVFWRLTTVVAANDVIDTVVNRNGEYYSDEQAIQQTIDYTNADFYAYLAGLSPSRAKLGDSVVVYGSGFSRDSVVMYSAQPWPASPRTAMPTTFLNSNALRFTVQGPPSYVDGSTISVWVEDVSHGPLDLTIPPLVCAPNSVTTCSPAAGACGQQVCAADGNSMGACTQISCGVCTPGAKQACDYRGKAGTSHCAVEQTCNGFGSGFSACADPTYQCGTWGSIEFKECAFTGRAKYVGILYDIPSGDDNRSYVLNHKANVMGQVMNARAHGWDLLGHQFGSFDVPALGCFVYSFSTLKTCTSPFSGYTLYMDEATGKTFRESSGGLCLGGCYETGVRTVLYSEPRGFRGKRCEFKTPTIPLFKYEW